MSNPAEVPNLDNEESSQPSAEIIDFKTRRPLGPDEIEARKREHPSWPVTIGENGEVRGLPEGVSQKEVILFKGPEGKWWAQNPSPELLEEIKLWQTDWQDV